MALRRRRHVLHKKLKMSDCSRTNDDGRSTTHGSSGEGQTPPPPGSAASLTNNPNLDKPTSSGPTPMLTDDMKLYYEKKIRDAKIRMEKLRAKCDYYHKRIKNCSVSAEICEFTDESTD